MKESQRKPQEAAAAKKHRKLPKKRTPPLSRQPTSLFIRAITQASTFKDFVLKEELNRAINEAGFEKPSEVQQCGIFYILYGEDLLCQAKSGTGKTAVFVIGILQSIKLDQGPFQALILCHTRELAFQISREFERLGKYVHGVKIATIFGGVDVDDQCLLLENNPPHILVGTPGRVLHMVKKDLIKLENLKYFVIDECDETLKQYSLLRRYETRHPRHFHQDKAEKTGFDVHRNAQRQKQGNLSEVPEESAIRRTTN